jgi:hypothetical protein
MRPKYVRFVEGFDFLVRNLRVAKNFVGRVIFPGKPPN